MTTTDVDITGLMPPATRPFADPGKVARYAPFNWTRYRPIIVVQESNVLTIMDGMTRVELARLAGIAKLPAYVFKAQ